MNGDATVVRLAEGESGRPSIKRALAYQVVDAAMEHAPSLPFARTTYLAFVVLLGLALTSAPPWIFNPYSTYFLFVIGAIGIWRYSWGALHVVRALIYRKWVFPRWRKALTALPDGGHPSEVFLLVTSFRIDPAVSRLVFGSVFAEAIRYGRKTTVIASIVEGADERLVRAVFNSFEPPANVRLCVVRIAGKGKRAGLGYGFRAVAGMMPAEDAVVCVIDGDSILERGLLEKTLPFFKLRPNVAALTTDEVCDVRGSMIYREWYNLRFAQRQIYMCSVGLSRRVLTLTGRMSAFRGAVVTDPSFIAQVEDDSIDHWRAGKIQFLTGDDKSSWYWILKNGYEMLYVPDVTVRTVEDPPDQNFLRGATMLMTRWFGNMLRTNSRAIALGPGKMGLYTWWCIVDQRLTMWTTLVGPVAAILIGSFYQPSFFYLYLLWVGCSRLVQTTVLFTVRDTVSGLYPFLLFFNQIYGACVKTHVSFRLSKQSWTRQKTTLARGASRWSERVEAYSNQFVHAVSLLLLVALVAALVGLVQAPTLGGLDTILGSLLR